MDVKDHEAIAGIIQRYNGANPTGFGLVEALADYMAADDLHQQEQAHYANRHGDLSGFTFKPRFDRQRFIAACYGEPAHQDPATPGRT